MKQEVARRVVIYGASLYMAIVEAALKDHPHLSLIRVDPAEPEARQHLSLLYPDVILVDETTSTLMASAAFPASPNNEGNAGRARVILLLPASPIVAVLFEQQYEIQNIQELTELIWLG